MNLIITSHDGFFTRCPAGFLYEDDRGTINTGVITETSPDGSFWHVVSEWPGHPNCDFWCRANSIKILCNAPDHKQL